MQAPPSPGPRPKANLGATLVDASPWGASASEPTSQRTEPLTQPKESGARPEASPLSRSVLAPTSVMPPALVAPPEPPPTAPVPVPAEPPKDDAPPSIATDVEKLPPLQKTMLGVAIPGIAPTAPEPPPAGPPGPYAPAEAGKPVHLKSHNATMLGVAVPGVRAGHGAVQGAPPEAAGWPNAQQMPSNTPTILGARGVAAPVAPPVPIVPAPAPFVDEPLPEAPIVPKKSGISAVAVVAIVFVLVAAIGGTAAVFALRTNRTLTANPQLDDSGRESLRVGCTSCPDGTKLTLGAASATITKGEALLLLPAPLSIGENDLDVEVDRPGAGRDEKVKIHVPVAYRVRADLSTLAAKPPAITVRVEATPGSEAIVDGKPLGLDGSGRGAYAIDLTSETEGPNDEQRTFEKKLPFSITVKGGKPETGELTARTAIVPLHLDAPGLALTTEKATAAISGQTRAGTTVTVDGQSAPVDPQGNFAVGVELPPGEKVLVIVASAPPLAPRTVRARVNRVTSLEAAGKAFESESPASLAYAAFESDPSARTGQRAVVEGQVVEARATKGHTTLLVDDRTSCAAKAECLVRVLHGEDSGLARGDTVRVYGRIAGTVNANGKTVADIDATIVRVIRKATR